VTEVDCGAAPTIEIGRYSTGCGLGMDALASPITLQAMNPPLITIFGGFTRRRPVPQHYIREFVSRLIPLVRYSCAIAGLMV